MLMMSKAKFTIKFENKQEVYYPGQYVQGEVTIQIDLEVKIRELRIICAGECNVAISSESEEGSTSYHQSEEYFKEIKPHIKPPPGQQTMMLQPGFYRYPFNFQIPANAPSSFRGGSGSILYYVAVILEKPGFLTFNESCIEYIPVIQLLDLNTIPEAKNPGEAQGSKNVCCFCCVSGPITGKIRIGKIGYVPGESIPVKTEFINHSRKNVKVVIELVQFVTYRAEGATDTNMLTIRQTPEHLVPRGESEYWSSQYITIPPVPSSSLESCKLISITYFWRMACTPSGICTFSLWVPIEIIIGSIPLENDFRGETFSNIPQRTFASFSTAQPSSNPGRSNVVQPIDTTQTAFQPKYPYYN